MSSFAYPNAGPFGICLNQQLQQTFNENVAFSESAWENAKQNCQYGCVLPPGIPQWPPGVTPLSAPPNMSLKTPIARTDAQVINTLQSKPFQFDSPFVETREYKRFVDNSSPAVVRSLENRCGAPAVSSAVASSAIIQNPATQLAMPMLSRTGVSRNANVVSLFFQSLVMALKGMNYDAKNFAQLPGVTTGQKLNFMMTHDSSRLVVLILAILLVFAVVALIVLIPIGACTSA